jgi:hypothetical protein
MEHLLDFADTNPALITPMFPLVEEALKTLADFRSNVMAGLDPLLSGTVCA